MTGKTSLEEVRKRAFTLTRAVYRVTDFFSPDEPLRRQIREKANEILASSIEYPQSSAYSSLNHYSLLKGKIAVLIHFLELAQTMELLHSINFTILIQEYQGISEGLAEEANPISSDFFQEGREREGEELRNDRQRREGSSESQARISPSSQKKLVHVSLVSHGDSLNVRQQTILRHLEGNPQAKISDFFTLFKDISSKTIQRDLQDLVARNLLRKEGEKRWTIYMRSIVQNKS